MGTAPAYLAGQHFLSQPIIRQKVLIGPCFLHRVQVLPLDILNQGNLGHLGIIVLTHHSRNSPEPCQLCRPEPPFPCNQLIALCGLPDQDRLQHAILLHGVPQGIHGLLLKLRPWLVWVGTNQRQIQLHDRLLHKAGLITAG